MRTGTRISLLLLAVILVGGAIALVLALRHGFSAREEPMALEAFAARRFRRLAVPRAAREMANPVPLTPEVLAEARAHFADHCAYCHGNDGGGRTPIGRNLYPKVPDMASAGSQSLYDGEIFYIIKNGIRLSGMPAWGEDTHGDDLETWRLVHFIRHLPDIQPAEIDEMNEMNPRTRREFEEEEEARRFLGGEERPSTPPKHEH